MPLLFATTNPHKLREVRAVLSPLAIEVIGLEALDPLPPAPREDGATFEANARRKAVAYARAAARTCLADDSGLEVDALGGAPGVRSARFAGVGATRDERDRANNAKLLALLSGLHPPRRAARFVCAMCLADASGRVLAETQGAFAGIVTDRPAGSHGFGYDPLLYLPEEGRTAAQLTAEEKNARSHRGQAARALAAVLRSKDSLRAALAAP